MSHHESSPLVALITSLIVILMVPVVTTMPHPMRLYADIMASDPVDETQIPFQKKCLPIKSPDFCYIVRDFSLAF